MDAQGHYDDFEVDRVVGVILAGAKGKAQQSELVHALEPVYSRLMHRFKSAQERLYAAHARSDATAAQAAKDEMDALVLFKGDMQTFQRIYAFLSQIFNFGNTDVEKRFIFYKPLLPLLEFGRERETIDLSEVELTHHTLRNLGKRALPLGQGEGGKLEPLSEAGSGNVQEKEKALLAEIIAKVNELFEGDLTENDRLVYVKDVIKGKLLESEALAQQAANNTKEQFANSPDLPREIMNAIIDALEAHGTMSRQVLESERVRAGLQEILLGPGRLYEALRGQTAQSEGQAAG